MRSPGRGRLRPIGCALRGTPLWVAVIAGQLLTFVQAIIGVVLTSRYDYELDDMHALYGFSAIITIGILYSYRTSPFMKGKELLLYGFGCLFIMGLGIETCTCRRSCSAEVVVDLREAQTVAGGVAEAGVDAVRPGLGRLHELDTAGAQLFVRLLAVVGRQEHRARRSPWP